jgi:hypothetical protein
MEWWQSLLIVLAGSVVSGGVGYFAARREGDREREQQWLVRLDEREVDAVDDFIVKATDAFMQISSPHPQYMEGREEDMNRRIGEHERLTNEATVVIVRMSYLFGTESEVGDAARQVMQSLERFGLSVGQVIRSMQDDALGKFSDQQKEAILDNYWEAGEEVTVKMYRFAEVARAKRPVRALRR